MRQTNDLGVNAYMANTPTTATLLQDPTVQKGGRSRGTPLLSTLPLRTRTAQGRPRTPGVVARVLGRAS